MTYRPAQRRNTRLGPAVPSTPASESLKKRTAHPSAQHPLAPEPPVLQGGAVAGATVLLIAFIWVLLWCVPFLRSGDRFGYHLAGFSTLALLAAWGATAHRRVEAATLAVAIYGLWTGVLVWLWAVHFPQYIEEFWVTPMRLSFLPAMVINGGVLGWLSLRNLRYRHLCRLDALRRKITGRRLPTASQDEIAAAPGWDEGNHR